MQLMTIKNNNGYSQGTEVLDSNGKPLDLTIASIDVSFRVDEAVTANVTLLKVPTDIEILPQNIHFWPAWDIDEVIDLIKDNYINDAIAHLEYMKGQL